MALYHHFRYPFLMKSIFLPSKHILGWLWCVVCLALGHQLADATEGNSLKLTDSPLSSQTPKSEMPLATAILKRLQKTLSSSQGLELQMSGEYRLDPSLGSPLVADMKFSAKGEGCIKIEGNDFLGEKLGLPYISTGKKEFLDKSKKTAWIPGEMTPKDLYKLLWIGAPIPDHFQTLSLSWSEKNTAWFKLTFIYTENGVTKEENLHIHPVTWRVMDANLRDTVTNRSIWEFHHEGELSLKTSSGAIRTLPQKTTMTFTFLSGPLLVRKRAILFTWTNPKAVSSGGSSSCGFTSP